MTIRGSCLCGAVAYEGTEPPVGVFHCHCSRCRKVRGTAHATNMLAPSAHFRFLRGEDKLVRFQPADAERFAHVFCPTCGSSLPNVVNERGYVIVPMGSLDVDPPESPAAHIYVGSKAGWETSTEGLPRHEAGPPQDWMAEASRAARTVRK